MFDGGLCRRPHGLLHCGEIASPVVDHAPRLMWPVVQEAEPSKVASMMLSFAPMQAIIGIRPNVIADPIVRVRVPFGEHSVNLLVEFTHGSIPLLSKLDDVAAALLVMIFVNLVK